MHDPQTVAFEIPNPLSWRKRRFDGKWEMGRLATIWHVDPETDGTDDSCGWFMRARHGDKETLKKIQSEFDYACFAEHGGFFDAHGNPRFSSIAITLGLFRFAAWKHFGDWKRVDRFMRKHFIEIVSFAENPIDSMHQSITNVYGVESREDRVKRYAAAIYGWILRAERPWWRAPRWHVHHWKIQVHALQAFKRWAFSRCAACGKGFSWGYAPVTDCWDSPGPRWFRSEEHVCHHECSNMKVARETGTVAH